MSYLEVLTFKNFSSILILININWCYFRSLLNLGLEEVVARFGLLAGTPRRGPYISKTAL